MLFVSATLRRRIKFNVLQRDLEKCIFKKNGNNSDFIVNGL